MRKIYATSFGIIIGFYAYGTTFWIFIAFVMIPWLMQRLMPWRTASVLMIATSYLLLFVRSMHGWYMGTNADICVKTAMMCAFIKTNFVAQNLRDAAVLREGIPH